jgi:hypothetical protein
MDTINVNGKEYILKEEATLLCCENIINSACFGKKVLVRSRNEGINAGIVVAADNTGVIIKECRRLWYHKPANTSLAWYEGIAISGISSDTKVSCTVPTKAIVEDYSITICTESAFESIMSAVPYGQN